VSRATLLISRQALYPHAGCKWVQAARKAVRWCRDNSHTVVTSVGVSSRNLVTALCALEKASCEMVLPSTMQGEAEQILSDYGLSRQTTQITYTDPLLTATKEDRLHNIDNQIVETAEFNIAVSIRKGGYMQRWLDSAERRGKAVVRDFETQYESASSPSGYSIDPASLSEIVRTFDKPLLIHWTRTSNGPWPGERSVDYYRDLIQSEKYPRTGFETLCRILSTKMLCASLRHIATSEPVVAFSSLSPVDVVPLMRWRARYREMSFEPYGIGIRSSIGDALGILPVKYGLAISGASGDAWLTQSIGKRTDWRRECECRHRGDLRFEQIDNANLFIFTRTEKESRTIAERFGTQSIWFER
jgi:hypothetical protein